MAGLSILRMGERRQPKGQREPYVPPASKGVEELARDILVLASVEKRCPVCKGAGWVGAHANDCPLEELGKLLGHRLRPDGLSSRTPSHIKQQPDGIVTAHGIPYERWQLLDGDQRARVQAKPGCSAVKVKCSFHEGERYVISPLPRGHALNECTVCFTYRSMGVSALEEAIKASIAMARALRGAERDFSASEERAKAKLMMKILKAMRAGETSPLSAPSG